MRSSRNRAAGTSRRRLPALILLAALVSPLLSCAARRAAQPPSLPASPVAALDALRADLAALFDERRPGGPVWSVRVESLTHPGDPIFTLQPDQLMVPASNMKIVTLAVAADRLGWGHTFPTTFRSTSRMWPDGTIRGDLVVHGTGDPMIGTLSTSTSSMSAIAEALWQQGVLRINGRVIGDDDAFADEPLGEGWAWDDVSFTYSAPIGPLIYNENGANITIVAGTAPGQA